MGNVFVGQTALRITLRTFCDLGNVEKAIIKYLNPNGSAGEFAAVVDENAKGNIHHDCIAGDIDVSGWWSFWAVVTMGDGRVAVGETSRVFVRRQGG